MATVLPPRADGGTRPLWLTEVGWNCDQRMREKLHQAVSREEQSRMAVRTLVLARAGGAERLLRWRLYDTFGSGFGLLGTQRTHFAPSPTSVASATCAALLGQAPRSAVAAA